MTERLKQAFDAVHADEALKAHTRAYLSERVWRKKRRSPLKRRVLPALAAACLVLILGLGGSFLYFTPTAFISIDINPSLELGVNRFDRIVSVEAYNEEGQALADTLDVKHLDYRQALELLLSNQTVEAYLSQDGVLDLTVSGENDSQCDEIYQAMEDCSSGHQNVHCHSSGSDLAVQAHAAGMSVGKYRAFLILRELDPDVTAEEVQGMSMAEIYALIDTRAQEQGVDPPTTWGQAGHGYGHNGHGYGHE